MDTDLTVGILQILGVFEHGLDILVLSVERNVECIRIRLLASYQLLQLRYVLVASAEIDLRHLLWHRAFNRLDLPFLESSVRHEAFDFVHDAKRHFLRTTYVGDSRLCCHRTISDDVRHLLHAVLLSHPVEHLATAVVVEVHVDIRERDTVRVEETLEQQVVLQRVEVCNFQAVRHHRAGSRATPRTYPHAQFLACGAYVVRHDKEVARETHRLHYVQLEVDTLLLLIC